MASFTSTLAGLVILALVALGDYSLGAEIGSDTFYLIPVAYAAWFAGLPQALALAALSAAAWMGVDAVLLHHAYANRAAPYCDAALAFSLFSAAAYLVARLKAALAREKELSIMKSEILSFASHELKNALALTGAGLGVVKAKLGDALDASTATILTSMESNQLQLRITLENLLNNESLELGRLKVEMGVADLRKIVEDCLASAQPLVAQRKLEVRLELEESPPQVRADAGALATVVSNLVGNAIKYTPRGGRITVSLKPVQGKLEFSVSDEGVGIPAEDLDKIFSGFYRSQNGREIANGFGLGLKLSRRLIESHGSTLAVRSVLGKGSRFSFQLDVEDGGIR